MCDGGARLNKFSIAEANINIIANGPLLSLIKTGISTKERGGGMTLLRGSLSHRIHIRIPGKFRRKTSQWAWGGGVWGTPSLPNPSDPSLAITCNLRDLEEILNCT